MADPRIVIAVLNTIFGILAFLAGYRIGSRSDRFTYFTFKAFGGIFLGSLFVFLYILLSMAAVKILVYFGWYPE